MTPAQYRIDLYRRDPVRMVQEEFQVTPDAWQKIALRAFADSMDPQKRRISLQACAGPGKTFVLAACGLNFILCYSEPGYHPQAAAMSIDADNLRDGLWKEFAVLMQRSKLFSELFAWTSTRIYAKAFPKSWFISARTFPKTANSEEKGRALSGLHAKYMLYLIDESGDQHTNILRVAEQGLSNCKWGKILTAGNPTSQTGILYYVYSQQAGLWTIIEINGDPEDANRSPRVDIEWAREQIKLYGRENPWVMSYILGKFPPGGLNAILTVEEVKEAMGRHLREDQFSWSQKRLGIDVARFGEDRTVIFPRQGQASYRPIIMRGVPTNDIAARASKAMADWHKLDGIPVEMVTIDDTGHWGHGVIDQMNAAGHSPIPVVFHAKALDDRYKNRRTEMWLEMAKAVKGGLALPPIPELVPELTVPTYSFDNGKFRHELWDQIKERLRRSPDLADALALTYAVPDQPRMSTIFPNQVQQRQMVQSDWNPFDGVGK